MSAIITKLKVGKYLILISLAEYNWLKQTTYLLSEINSAILWNANNELEAGKGIQKEILNKWDSSGLVLLGKIICSGRKLIRKKWNELMSLLKAACEQR